MSSFNKPALNLDAQIKLLSKRGLRINDEARARHYLSNISYYRLSAYLHTFYQWESDEHCFISGTTFDEILSLYIFDRELRLILLDAIERLEVALRAQLTNTLAEHH